MPTIKQNELAHNEAGAIEFRAEPLRVQWSIADLSSADHHALECRFSCSVRIVDSDADRRMFTEVFLSSRDAVTAEVVAAHFLPGIRSALQSRASKSPAAAIVEGSATGDAEWLAAIRSAADPIAFATGLEMLAPFQLDLQSPSLQRHQIDQISQARSEARTAGQIQHLQRASELLKQFQDLRRGAPDLPAGKLLEQFNAADRGLALQTLLLAAAENSRDTQTSLFAGSGKSLIHIDLSASPPRVKAITLPESLGPLRSVQPGKPDESESMLVGARDGVLIVYPRKPEEAQPYHAPNLQSQLGFNAATIANEMLWASHSEAGIVGWKLDSPTSPAVTFPERSTSESSTSLAGQSLLISGSLRATGISGQRVSGARNLVSFDLSTLAYSVGRELILRSNELRSTVAGLSTSPIIALIPTTRSILAVYQDGVIGSLDRATRQLSEVRRRGRRICAAANMPWLGESRLLLATEDGPIDCIGIDDAMVTEYLSPYAGIKMLTATGAHIAAVTPDRQRIVIWATSDYQRPQGEVHITGLTKHRVADLRFLPTHGSTAV